MTLHDHEKPIVLGTVLGTLMMPILLVAIGVPASFATVPALGVAILALGLLEGRIQAHHRAVPVH
jgi:hypothetical protein